MHAKIRFLMGANPSRSGNATKASVAGNQPYHDGFRGNHLIGVNAGVTRHFYFTPNAIRGSSLSIL